MVDLKGIVSVIQIESVRLCEARCRSGVHPSELADAITVKTSRKTAVVQEPTDRSMPSDRGDLYNGGAAGWRGRAASSRNRR